MARETESDNQPTELYDFLYRDLERIASYYAQIWNGKLLTVEESHFENERSEQTLKGDIRGFDQSSVSPVHETQNQIAQAFFPLLFPSNALRMIPLAIYRKVPIHESSASPPVK